MHPILQTPWPLPYEIKAKGSDASLSFESILATVLITLIGLSTLKLIYNALSSATKDSAEVFWRELKEKEAPPLPTGPVIIWGQIVAKDIPSLQLQIFSTCNGKSQLFAEYMGAKSLKLKHVIDLGCGIGANSRPLLAQGITVTAIDCMKPLLEIYKKNLCHKEKQFVTLQCADIALLRTFSKKPHIVDAVLACDVLPYLPSSCWKSTMEKIALSLKPGGYLFATVFVKNAWFNHPVIATHERWGANYYAIPQLAWRLVLHCGFEMVECRKRKEGRGCYEFVARLPGENAVARS